MLGLYKINFRRALADKEPVNSITEYISKFGACPDNFCRNICKERYCRDKEGFYDIDKCTYGMNKTLRDMFALKSAWNPACRGRACEFFMICFVSAVRELFRDTHSQMQYPEAVEKIRQYDLCEQPIPI